MDKVICERCHRKQDNRKLEELKSPGYKGCERCGYPYGRYLAHS